MRKSWLIRTKNNHILGPVSKDKIKELLKNGSIKGDDEICSANGHWIYVREDELIEKYVTGETKQEFNPVQEAQPCVISEFPPDMNLLIDRSEDQSETNQVRQTLVQKNPILESTDETNSIENQSSSTVGSVDKTDQKKNEKRIIKKRNLKGIPIHSKKSQGQLSKSALYLLVVLFVLILFVSIWKKGIILEQLNKLGATSFISSAVAQNFDPEKKNIGIHLS